MTHRNETASSREHPVIPNRTKHTASAVAILCIASLLGACRPGVRTICRDLIENLGEDPDNPWLNGEEGCYYALESAQAVHSEEWKDLSLCFARATTVAEVQTCGRVVDTLTLADRCAQILDISGLQREGPEGVINLSSCVDDERTRLNEDRTLWSQYVSCVNEAASADDIQMCRDDHASEMEEAAARDAAEAASEESPEQ